jgi:dipeptidyl aminopeptidase/acylaminoacyl peptidase
VETPSKDSRISVGKVWGTALLIGVLVSVSAGALRVSLPGLKPSKPLKLGGTLLVTAYNGEVLAFDPTGARAASSVFLDRDWRRAGPLNAAPWWSPQQKHFIIPSPLLTTSSGYSGFDGIFTYGSHGERGPMIVSTNEVRSQWVSSSATSAIALAGTSPNSTESRQWVMPPGRALARLKPAGIGRASWSPDGDEVAYSCDGPRDGLEICLTPVDGSHSVLVPIRGLAPVHILYDPAFSPDGKRLAFTARLQDAHVDVFTVDTDGTHLRRITHDTREKHAPQWSPAGTAVAFLAGTKLVVHSANAASEMTVAQGLPVSQSLQWAITNPATFTSQTP